MLDLSKANLPLSPFLTLSPVVVAVSLDALQGGQAEKPKSAAQGAASISSSAGQAFTPQERAQIVAKVFALPRVSVGMKAHRLRALRVVREPSEKEASRKHLASVVLFNYTLGKATRFVIDSSTGALVREEPLRGRPQASEEELQEAATIIQADAEHARLMRAGGILEGGFIVDGPLGTPPLHRFLQLQVLTADRRGIQRLVIVDLTAGAIASSKPI